MKIYLVDGAATVLPPMLKKSQQVFLRKPLKKNGE